MVSSCCCLVSVSALLMTLWFILFPSVLSVSCMRTGGSIELKNLGGGEEYALCFRWCGPSSNVHFEAKSLKVMVYKFNALDQVVACGEDEGTIINI